MIQGCFIWQLPRGSLVRIHRAVPGQGFLEQAFQLLDVQSLSGYNVGDRTFLSAVQSNKIQTFVARIRGLKKMIEADDVIYFS